MCFNSFHQCQLFCDRLVISCCSDCFGNSSFQDLKVWKDQLQVDRLNVTQRINTSVYMDNIAVLETTYYMNNCINLTDICKKLVSKTFSFGCTFYKTCDIYKLNRCRNDLFGVIHLTKHIQTFIRYSNNAHIWINGTEWVVGWFCSCFCQWIK